MKVVLGRHWVMHFPCLHSLGVMSAYSTLVGDVMQQRTSCKRLTEGLRSLALLPSKGHAHNYSCDDSARPLRGCQHGISGYSRCLPCRGTCYDACVTGTTVVYATCGAQDLGDEQRMT